MVKVYGVGINDLKGKRNKRGSGTNNKDVVGEMWRNMLARCYSNKYQDRFPSYKGCYVCEEWLLFSNFKSWVTSNDWKGLQLDKDILISGNKVYSPTTCVFVSKQVNSFLSDRALHRGEYPLGVYLSNGKFKSCCSDPFTGKRNTLGYFSTPEKAHEVWKKEKHRLANLYADIETDKRVADRLRVMFS